jgi:hypothetical protein
VKRVLGYGLIVAIIGALILLVAEGGTILGSDISERMVRFINLDL